MTRKTVSLLIVLCACAAALDACRQAPKGSAGDPVQTPATVESKGLRPQETLFAELQPIRLANCELERFGEKNDGGYLLCANLLGSVRSAYSYGISGYDGWGCQVSKRLNVAVHEYDCFNLDEPACPGGRAIFHAECVAAEPSTDRDHRVFDTPQHQIEKNGDAGRHLVVKIDVEGAEWDTLRRAPDSVLESIDQLAVEFHGVDQEHFAKVVRRLKRFFYVANLHFNNYSCTPGQDPFPSWAYEVLFVSKRLGVPDTSGTPVASQALNAPNNPNAEDCQAVTR